MIEKLKAIKEKFKYIIVANNSLGLKNGVIQSYFVGGENLRHSRENLSKYFDSNIVYDHTSRTIPFDA